MPCRLLAGFLALGCWALVPPASAAGSGVYKSTMWYDGATSTVDFLDVAANAEGGSVVFPIDGLPAMPDATFTSIWLVPAQSAEYDLTADADPQNPYASLTSRDRFMLIPNIKSYGIDTSTLSQLAIIEVTSVDATTVLHAGLDRNDDGFPESFEQVCEATMTVGGPPARCAIDLRDVDASIRNVWAFVDVPDGAPGVVYPTTLSAGAPADGFSVGPPDPALSVTGPGHVAAGAAFPLRVSWRASGGGRTTPTLLAPDTRYYGAVKVLSAPAGQDFLPLAIQLQSKPEHPLQVLASDATVYDVLLPGESLQRDFIDVPAAGTLNVVVSCSGSCVGPVDFYALRADFPDFGQAPDAAPAPPVDASTAHWSLDTSSYFTSSAVPVTAGRWYLVAKNNSSETLGFWLTPTLDLATSIPPPPGAYYNPQRAGHGIFVSRAGDQQVAYWYAFDDDGSPIWYVAQGNVPSDTATVWTADLQYVTINAEQQVAYHRVGDVILTPIEDGDVIFSWHLNGTAGSERFTLLGPSQCVPFGGTQANFTGQWFAPAQAGYGLDVLALPEQQFDAFYFYDALGEPRWAAGSSTGFAANTPLTMHQFSGFCPSCAYTPATHVPIGTMNVNFVDATQGTLSTDLTLAPPLSGTWIVDQPLARLTGSLACGQ